MPGQNETERSEDVCPSFDVPVRFDRVAAPVGCQPGRYRSTDAQNLPNTPSVPLHDVVLPAMLDAPIDSCSVRRHKMISVNSVFRSSAPGNVAATTNVIPAARRSQARRGALWSLTPLLGHYLLPGRPVWRISLMRG